MCNTRAMREGGLRSWSEILASRHALYLEARAGNPRRWTGDTRNWHPIAAVTLNPERESVIEAAIHEARGKTLQISEEGTVSLSNFGARYQTP